MRHYTVQEVAARYGVHESTIRRDIAVGKLEAYERLAAALPPPVVGRRRPPRPGRQPV